MDSGALGQVRRFNRLVTQRVGALDDAFLARDRPLGAARVLWEIGPDGCDVRELRSLLDLDSGYLSRLLRSLERDGLVTVTSSAADRRVRIARLTPLGVTERLELDRRSDEAAVALLEPLDPGRRERLVAAMAEVERLFTASLVRIGPAEPRDPAALAAKSRYFAELGDRFEEGYDPAAAIQVGDDDLVPPSGVLLLATLHGAPVGCAVAKFQPDGTAHAKRMWIADEVRGLGLGRRILGELETVAAAHGVRRVRLETHRSLHEAIGLYRSAGYREVDRFNDEIYGHHFFEKALTS